MTNKNLQFVIADHEQFLQDLKIYNFRNVAIELQRTYISQDVKTNFYKKKKNKNVIYFT